MILTVNTQRVITLMLDIIFHSSSFQNSASLDDQKGIQERREHRREHADANVCGRATSAKARESLRRCRNRIAAAATRRHSPQPHGSDLFPPGRRRFIRLIVSDDNNDDDNNRHHHHHHPARPKPHPTPPTRSYPTHHPTSTSITTPIPWPYRFSKRRRPIPIPPTPRRTIHSQIIDRKVRFIETIPGRRTIMV